MPSKNIVDIICWFADPSIAPAFPAIIEQFFLVACDNLLSAEDDTIATQAKALCTQTKEILHIMDYIKNDKVPCMCALIHYHSALVRHIPDKIQELFVKWPRYAMREMLYRRRIATLKFIIDIEDLSMLAKLNFDYFEIKYERITSLSEIYHCIHNDEEKADLLCIIRHEMDVLF